MKSCRMGSIVGILAALLSAGTIRAELIFFDNFNQLPAGTDLTQTNYAPAVGASAEIETNETPGENSTTAVATNFLGSTWLMFATGTPPYQGLYEGVPTVAPISQVVTESFTLWIPSTTSTNNIGGLGLNLPSTNSFISIYGVTNIDDEPIVFISDGGPIATFTGSPSPQSFVPIGNWSGRAGTAMTNVLVINYSAGTFSFSLNGTVLTNMPIPSYIITNLFDAVRLRISEDISNGVYLSLGNTFALGDITVTTPTTSTNQDVAIYVPAAKIQFFQQTSSSNVVPQTAGFGFQASADGTGSNTILGATDQCPSGSNLVLTLSDPSSSSFKFEQTFTTQSALDAAYTTGTYAIAILTVDDGTLTGALGLPADDYPNTPQLLNYDAAQAIDPSSPFDFVWGAFTNGTTNDFVVFEIDDVLGNTITNSPDLGQPGQLDGTATNFVISGGTLPSSGAYTGRLEFIKITAPPDTNTIAGAIGVTAYGEQIEFGLVAACSFSLDSTNASFGVAGGSGTVAVTANGTNCPWTAVSNSGFISITSATNGTGNGTVSYTVAANTSAMTQAGSMTIAGQTYTVTEAAAACFFSLDSTNVSFGAAGGSNNVAVTANGTSCAWTAISNSGFITITAGTNGTGNGTVSYTVAANTNAITQTGSMTIAGQTFTVTEAAAACTFSLDSTNASFSADGGSSNVDVTANGTNCAWTAVSNSGFITITAGTNGTGDGTVSYTVAANTNTFAQSGSMTIAGQTFAVTETAAACSFSLTSTNASFSADGGSSNVAFTANGTNCAWTAVSNSGFITITSATNGTGNGTVSYTVAANTNTVAQTGSMTFGGQTFAVYQAGATLSFEFTHVVQDCNIKIDKKDETTNVTCTVALDLSVTNTGLTNTPKFSVLLWLEQGPTFSTEGPSPLIEKVAALKENKEATVKFKSKKIYGYLSGTYIFATDAETNVLASVAVPNHE